MIFNYIRVSTASQSTERQLINITCDRIFKDITSGKNRARPQLELMMLSLRAGDFINVHELSRLARNTKDLLELVEQVLSAGASIKFHKENLSFDGDIVDDPFQKLMLTMLGAISTFERDLLLDRIAEGIAIAKSKGIYKGRKSKFSKTQVADIRQRFNDSSNKSKLAEEIGITRAYLYRLVA
jgi:DNA invertase Pin-like site-specific DNA recombinase